MGRYVRFQRHGKPTDVVRFNVYVSRVIHVAKWATDRPNSPDDVDRSGTFLSTARRVKRAVGLDSECGENYRIFQDAVCVFP